MDKFQIIRFTAEFVSILRDILVYSIIARIIVSWFTLGQHGPHGRIIQFLHDITDPVINLVRKLPHRISMIDFAPLIAIIGLDLAAQLIIALLAKLV